MYIRILYQSKVAAKDHHCWPKFQNACEANISCWVVCESWSLGVRWLIAWFILVTRNWSNSWMLSGIGLPQSPCCLPHAQICNGVRYAAPAMNSELWPGRSVVSLTETKGWALHIAVVQKNSKSPCDILRRALAPEIFSWLKHGGFLRHVLALMLNVAAAAMDCWRSADSYCGDCQGCADAGDVYRLASESVVHLSC